MRNKYSFLDVESIDNPLNIWNQIIEKSLMSSWLHNYNYYKFSISSSKDSNLVNKSFFVYSENKYVALAIVLIHDVKPSRPDGRVSKEAYDTKREATCYGSPLPWPCIVELKDANEFDEIEDIIFEEIEKRVIEENSERVRFILCPSNDGCVNQEKFFYIIKKRSYIDSSYVCHNVIINHNTISKIRKRYKQYIRKFSSQFNLIIMEGTSVTKSIEETHFKLHVKDAEGQFRSRNSYANQADCARNHEAFFVMAKLKSTGVIVGSLLIALHKENAVDWSVGIDPDYINMYVSHLLKLKTIETLIARGYNNYDLGGIKAVSPSLNWQPSKIQYGISHFKDGWARGCERKYFVAEKFLTKNSLDFYLDYYNQKLNTFFFKKTSDTFL